MKSLTITFTDEEWAEAKAAAHHEGISTERFAHDAVLVAAHSHSAREEDRDLLREESAALMNNPKDRAAMRRVHEEFPS